MGRMREAIALWLRNKIRMERAIAGCGKEIAFGFLEGVRSRLKRSAIAFGFLGRSAISFAFLVGVRSRLERKGAIAFLDFGKSVIGVGKKESNCFADAMRSRLRWKGEIFRLGERSRYDC